MNKVKFVRVDGDKFLDDKGRVWLREFISPNVSPVEGGYTWMQIDLPDEPGE